jgi:hypothetical protein
MSVYNLPLLSLVVQLCLRQGTGAHLLILPRVLVDDPLHHLHYLRGQLTVSLHPPSADTAVDSSECGRAQPIIPPPAHVVGDGLSQRVRAAASVLVMERDKPEDVVGVIWKKSSAPPKNLVWKPPLSAVDAKLLL